MLMVYIICLWLFKESKDAVERTPKMIKLSWLIFWQPTFRMFEKEPGKWVVYTKSRLPENPLLNKKQSSKTKQNQENDQNSNRSYEVCFFEFVFKKFGRNLLTRRDQPIETRQTTNKSFPPSRKGFNVKKQTEHGLLRTILIQNLIS